MTIEDSASRHVHDLSRKHRPRRGKHVSDTFERILTFLILPEAEAPWERDDPEDG